MKKCVWFFIFCVQCLILKGQDHWITFTPKGQNFEVMVPGVMTNGEKKILTEIGSLHAVTWLYQGQKDDANYLYSVSYVDYPEGSFDRDSTDLIQAFFEAGMETHIQDLKGELIYKSASNLDFYPGLLYRARYNDGKAIVKSRMLLVHDRFYALQVYTLVESSLNNDMNRFLESFRLIKPLQK